MRGSNLKGFIRQLKVVRVLVEANAINDKGQIVGYGDINGQTHAFLLTPVTLEVLDPLCSSQNTCNTSDYLVQTNSGVRLTQDTNRLMQMKVQRDGTVADGVTPLLLRIRSDSPVTFTLQAEDGSTPAEQSACLWGRLEALDGSASSCNTLTVQPQDVPNEGKVVFAVFRAPDGVPQSAGSVQTRRNVTVNASLDSSTNLSQSLILQAPPVVLVHGVWSSAKAWRQPIQGLSSGYESQLTGLGLDVYLVDHSNIGQSASSFDPYENAQVFQQLDLWISSAKFRVRSKGSNGLAISQVDVIGHSMGGLIARARTVAKTGLPYQRPDNAWQGDFHKIITIGTPHRGTPLADTLVANNCKLLSVLDGSQCLPSPDGCVPIQKNVTLQDFFSGLGRPLGPAVLGFQTGSQPINHIGATPVQGSAIVGVAPQNSNTEYWLNKLMGWFSVNATVDSLLDPISQNQHDTIVPVTSQRGGMTGSASWAVIGIIHADIELSSITGIGTTNDVAETQSRQVFNRVKSLLFKPAHSTEFANFSGLGEGGTYRSLVQCTSNAKALQAPSVVGTPLFTLLPLPGTVVRPGYSINLSFNVTGGVTTTEGMFAIDSELHYMQGAMPYSLQYTVPNNRAGAIHISAWGFGPQNFR
jgi:probable HAF family extracellular repeat protein